MPSFMAVHGTVDADSEAVAETHRSDQEAGTERGVDYRTFWIDGGRGLLSLRGPSKDAGAEVDRDAHGREGDEIYDVGEHESDAGPSGDARPPDATGGPDPPDSERPPPPSGATTPARQPTTHAGE